MKKQLSHTVLMRFHTMSQPNRQILSKLHFKSKAIIYKQAVIILTNTRNITAFLGVIFILAFGGGTIGSTYVWIYVLNK